MSIFRLCMYNTVVGKLFKIIVILKNENSNFCYPDYNKSWPATHYLWPLENVINFELNDNGKSLWIQLPFNTTKFFSYTGQHKLLAVKESLCSFKSF